MTAIDTHHKAQTPAPPSDRGAFQEGAEAGAVNVCDCYFIARNLRPLSQEKVRCADDRAAMQAAGDLLRQHTCSGIEVWHRGRCVGQLIRKIKR